MWPGTGHPSEQTSDNIANAVSPEGASRDVWRRAFESLMRTQRSGTPSPRT